MSKWDKFYRTFIWSNFYTKGWGDPENLRKILNFRKTLSNRESCQHLVDADHQVVIERRVNKDGYEQLEGYFISPFTDYLPGIMPEAVRKANFQMLLPHTWKGKQKPMCLHLAGTGDHGFNRRHKYVAKPLLKESGIGSILLENPFYGRRKPKEQFRSSLLYVSDLFVMGGALILESMVLLNWCERQGFGPLGITGISMGGYMASLAASNWPRPLALVPCLSWSTASSVFTKGILSDAVAWKTLQEQYENDAVYERELAKLCISPEKNIRQKSFFMGKEFAALYPHTYVEMQGSDKKVNQFQDIIEEVRKNASDRAMQTVADLQKVELDIRQHSNQNQNVELDVKQQSDHSQSQSSPKSGEQFSNNRTAKFHTSSAILTPENHSAIKTNKKGKHKQLFSIKSPRTRALEGGAMEFMKLLMDHCTHMGNYEVPLDPSLIIIIAATHDAYVPRDSVISLADIWPGSEVRYIQNKGHITSFLYGQRVFRRAITDALNRQAEKYML